MVKLPPNVSESRADSGKTENSVYNDLLSHRDVICLPQLRFGATQINEYALTSVRCYFAATS